MLNKFGKTLTIFLALIIVLLVSATSIGFFLYNKEVQSRKSAEELRDVTLKDNEKLQTELKDMKKQITILQDKNKDADNKINNLLDEQDLNEGLRNELKKENAALKEQMESINKLKEKMKADFDDSQGKLKQIQDLLKAEEVKSKELQKRAAELEDLKNGMEKKISEMKSDMSSYEQRNPEDQIASEVIAPGRGKSKVELDKIVVSPQDGVKGHILSVDKEAEFIVCNLGLKQGVKSGDVLSIYRGDEYLGDVKATRVQEEMSAADLIPPFSSRKVRKNDTVIFKQ